MPRNVEIAAGKYNVTLPNGRLYNAGDEVVLTDDEWGDVDPDLVPGTIIDNGATEEGGGGTTDGLTDTQLRATAVPVNTELAAAAALADGAANPTTAMVGAALLGHSGGQWWMIRCNPPSIDAIPETQVSLETIGFLHGYNGATWDRLRSDVTNGLDVDVTRLPAGPATGTTTSVDNAVTVQTLKAANASRKGLTIFNDDTATTGAVLKIKLGAAAAADSFTYAIPPQGYYEVPYGYTGIVTGIASAATGSARVTELT